MKKLLFTAGALLLLTACGSGKEELLVGKWKESNEAFETTFNQDGTFVTGYYDESAADKGKWRIDGDMLYTLDKGADKEVESEISVLNDKKLVIVMHGLMGVGLEIEYTKVK